MTINDALQRVKRVDLRNTLPELVEKTSEEIIKLNQSQLYTQSKDALGIYLMPYQSPSYALMKHNMNSALPIGRPDLNLTGDFYSGMFVNVTRETFEINSRDSKTNDLVEKYGSILGLMKESKEEYSIVLLSEIKRYITAITGFGWI